MTAHSAPPSAAMVSTDLDPPAHASLPRPSRAGFLAAWSAFWLLLVTIAVQDHLRQGQTDLWRPLLWEGTSFLVASAIVGLLWPRLQRSDPLLARPLRWFATHLVWLPPAAVVFVVVVYSLRHAVYAALGETYRHEAWGVVFLYETLKFGLFYILFVAILFGIRSHVALSDAQMRAERARGLVQQAQLLQLTQQLEPHFLFNALNTIAATVHTDAALADTLLIRLAALLRAATDLARQPEVTLGEELRLLDAYIAIMQARFAGRVDIHVEVEPAAQACRVPTLVLQPLVENVFRHAVEPRSALTHVWVRAHVAGSRLRLVVEDDGGVLPTEPRPGVGLANLKQRLALRHGTRAEFRLAPRAGGGVTACIELPCES